MFTKYSIELRKAIEATGHCYFCNGYFCIKEQCLYVSDSCHLNVVGYGETGYLFESMRKVAGTYAKMPGEKVEGQILGIMGVNIARDRIDLLLHLCQVGFVGVYITVLVEKQEDQKFNKLLMNDQIPHGVFFGSELVYIV